MSPPKSWGVLSSAHRVYTPGRRRGARRLIVHPWKSPCRWIDSRTVDRSSIKRAMLLAWRGFDYYARRVFAAPTFPRLFFQTSYIFMRACCVSIRPSVSPSIPQHGAVVRASEPVLCPRYARGRGLRVLLHPLPLVAAPPARLACVFLEDTRAHASRRRAPVHLSWPYVVFSSVVGEKQPIQGRVRVYVSGHTVPGGPVWALYPVERVPAHLY